jgi:DNA-binding transcriptional MerR regulator
MSTPATPTPSSYTIDEVARLGGSTVRNVRAYQERGILPPPIRHGRVGLYNDDHLARLRVINDLLSRGYSIANISELLQAFEQGQALSRLIGIDTALTSHWLDDLPSEDMPLSELIARLPIVPTTADIQRAVELGIIEQREGDLVRLVRSDLLQLAIPFLQHGMSLSSLLDVIYGVRQNVDHIAASALTKVAVELVFGNSSCEPRRRIRSPTWSGIFVPCSPTVSKKKFLKHLANNSANK